MKQNSTIIKDYASMESSILTGECQLKILTKEEIDEALEDLSCSIPGLKR